MKSSVASKGMCLLLSALLVFHVTASPHFVSSASSLTQTFCQKKLLAATSSIHPIQASPAAPSQPEELVEAGAQRASTFYSNLKSGWIMANHKLVSFHAAFLTGLTYLVFELLHAGVVTKSAVAMFFITEIPLSILLAFITWHTVIAIHEMGHYIEAKKLQVLRSSAETEKEDKLIASNNMAYFGWLIKMFFSIPCGLFPGIKKVEGNFYVETKMPNLRVDAAGPTWGLYLALPSLVVGLTLFVIGLVLTVHGASLLGIIPTIYLGRLLIGFGIVGVLDVRNTDDGAFFKYRTREKEAALRQAQAKSETAAVASNMVNVLKEALARMKASRFKEVKGEHGMLRAPWQFRNTIQGGEHVGDKGNISFQEFMIIPIAKSFEEAANMANRIQDRVEQIMTKTPGLTFVANGIEGGVVGTFENYEEQVLKVLVQAIGDEGYKPGINVFLALDPAASELANHYKDSFNTKQKGMYQFWKRNDKKVITSEEMIALYERWIQEYPIISIEDGLSEDDHDGWKVLMERLGDKVLIIGDDLVTTNDTIIEEALKKRLINAVLIKPNQIGTLCETLLAMDVGVKHGAELVVSHRSKSGIDDIEAHLALAYGTFGQKTGGAKNAERQQKYMAGQLELAFLENGVFSRIRPNQNLKIVALQGQEVPTNAGPPTVKVIITLSDGTQWEGTTPVGTSSGTTEAFHLVDGDKERFKGKGQHKAVEHVNSLIAPLFVGKSLADLGDLVEIDRQLLQLEKAQATLKRELASDAAPQEVVKALQWKHNVGMNAILPTSLAMLRLLSYRDGKRPWQILRELSNGQIDRSYLYGSSPERIHGSQSFSKRTGSGRLDTSPLTEELHGQVGPGAQALGQAI